MRRVSREDDNSVAWPLAVHRLVRSLLSLFLSSLVVCAYYRLIIPFHVIYSRTLLERREKIMLVNFLRSRFVAMLSHRVSKLKNYYLMSSLCATEWAASGLGTLSQQVRALDV